MIAMVDGSKHCAQMKRYPDGWTTMTCKCRKKFSAPTEGEADAKWLEHCRRVGFSV